MRAMAVDKHWRLDDTAVRDEGAKRTRKDERYEGVNERRDPEQENAGNGDVSVRTAAVEFDDVEAVTLDEVVCGKMRRRF